jgi:hypothetical protein
MDKRTKEAATATKKQKKSGKHVEKGGSRKRYFANATFTIDRNKRLKAERHKKRMAKQAKRVAKMKVKRGTGRKLNTAVRAARRKAEGDRRAYWQTEFSKMKAHFDQLELERKMQAKRDAKLAS